MDYDMAGVATVISGTKEAEYFHCVSHTTVI